MADEYKKTDVVINVNANGQPRNVSSIPPQIPLCTFVIILFLNWTKLVIFKISSITTNFGPKFNGQTVGQKKKKILKNTILVLSQYRLRGDDQIKVKSFG